MEGYDEASNKVSWVSRTKGHYELDLSGLRGVRTLSRIHKLRERLGNELVPIDFLVRSDGTDLPRNGGVENPGWVTGRTSKFSISFYERFTACGEKTHGKAALGILYFPTFSPWQSFSLAALPHQAWIMFPSVGIPSR